MITIMCIYNNYKVYSEMLLPSLQRQSFQDFKLIAVDNRNNCCFSSVNEALQEHRHTVDGDFLLIVHQDIVFENQFVLENFVKWLYKLENVGVIGVAGCPEIGTTSNTYSNIIQGSKREHPSAYQLSEPIITQTVDECMFALSKQLLSVFEFTDICTGWHLYATEMSLIAEQANFFVYTVPTEGIYHVSPGVSLDKTYLKILCNIFEKYQNVSKIYTTMGLWDKEKSYKYRFLLLQVKMRIKSILKR